MSRPLSSHGSQAQTNPSAAAKALSLKGCSHQLSSAALFVTNLRLLDFDLCDDWPDITVHTFTAKDAQQNQKKRIQCTEWALFRLFELWDREETREKLSPFFPPLEPLQSLNLRGALYRCLNDLKKNGVLGRETVLRKTMLDECKGDKLMETLVLFSTAVLKKKMSSRKSKRKNLTVARQYATAANLSPDQQASLLPLVIAHKAALTNTLRGRDDMRERYMDFGDLLVQSSHEAVQRNEKCGEILETLEESGKDLPDATSIKRILHDNWLGNPEWLELMVQGEQAEADDGLFQRPFEDIWGRVQLGQEVEEETRHHQSLLQDLEARVKGQEDRLSRWKAFHEKIQASRPEEPAPKVSNTRSASLDFNFDRHQDLRLGKTAPHGLEDEEYAAVSKLSESYGSILANMREDLEVASRVKSNRPEPNFVHKPKPSSIPMQPAGQRRSLVSRPRARPEHTEPPSPEPKIPAKPSFNRPNSPDWFSPLKNSQVTATQSEYETEEPVRSPSPTPTRSTFDNRSILEQYASDHEGSEPRAADSPPPPEELADEGPIHEPASPIHHRRSPSPPAPSPSPPPNHEDLLAEQILAGIDAASPSPVKQQQQQQQSSYLTLMERTRLTMEGHTSSPAKPTPAPRALAPEEQAKADATAALIERTRQTMLAMAPQQPPASSNPKKNAKGRNRSGSSSAKNGNGGNVRARRRASLFPPNPWEDKRKFNPLFEEWAEKATAMELEEKGLAVPAAAGRATPKDKLFEEDVDESSVFKSRPKIAASPLLEPEEGGDGVSELGGGGSELEYDDAMEEEEEVDEEDEEDETVGAWESSPLKGRER
ncbi:uncharacterized protein BKCO1_3000262 [Diplodia corticola]|uniref:HAUS augmin-like complex subunit 6 N-terminal domain-containing protein n=1 Tax=Diplodia corticola TaxID=236234 RepID=A0A1J9SEJ7_9PEZI|nr:uncharacterized protein BKCO1_3000262 [Diplodia corticola]OJD38839.1 hypothetical protein BKCO1_3000262 [Diplodia corticola]